MFLSFKRIKLGRIPTTFRQPLDRLALSRLLVYIWKTETITVYRGTQHKHKTFVQKFNTSSIN